MKILDLRDIPCPQNSSKALIYLATIETGESVEIWVDDGEPIKNVPESLSLEGHKIENITQTELIYWVIKVIAA
jgi:TusA-related sulfurtransferase